MAGKRFSELDLLKVWIVPTAAFMICAAGFVGGVLAGLLGRTDLFVSGGAEHQGPNGGGPVALIAEC